MDNTLDNTLESANRVYGVSGLAPTIPTCSGGGHQPKIIDVSIVAQRGRGMNNEQQLEERTDGLVNCITSVSKDCMVLEKERKENNHLSYHHQSGTRLYNIWCCMKGRCFNEKQENYPKYGGRGITVCEEWKENFMAFYEWAINNGYTEELSIDRIDNDGNYEPSNCRWVTQTEQVNNRSCWGEIPYYGIVKDNTGYRAQVTVKGKKIYIAHSKDDIEYLVNERNKYIDEHNLPCKKNVYVKESVYVKQATAEGYIECELPGIADLNYINSTTRRGRVQEGGQISPTIATENTPSVLERFTWEIDGQKYLVRIRKLTPHETWNLMDFSDEDFYKAEKVLSNTQLYRASGDSIVRNVLCEIFKQFF